MWRFGVGLTGGRAWIILAAVIILFVFCILPIAYMAGLSFLDTSGNVTLDNYRDLVLDARQQRLFGNTVLLGICAAAVATLVGAPLGLLLARVRIPKKWLVRTALMVPLLLPPYVLGLVWIYIAGPVGLIAHVLGRDVLSSFVYSIAGAVIVLGLNFFPLAMLAAEAALRRVDGRLEEAALMVTPVSNVLWRITLPLIAPMVAAAALLVFVLATTDYSVPGLLRVRVFTTESLTAFAAMYDFGRATVLAMPLLLLAFLATLAAGWMLRRKSLVRRRSAPDGLRLSSGRMHNLLVTAMMSCAFLAVFVPPAVLGWEAGGVRETVDAARASYDALRTSAVLALVAATFIVLAGLVLGYVRARFRGGAYADVLFISLAAVPSSVVGVGLIGLWNRPGILGAVYESPLIVLLGYSARFLPLAALLIGVSMLQVPESHEEAATLAGAQSITVLRKIVLPQIPAAIAATWIITVIFCFGELGATLLVSPPGTVTLPVRIYTLIANAPPSQVAALALTQLGALFIPIIVLASFSRVARAD